MSTETKPWGTTTLIENHQNTTVHALEIVPGGYCSLHFHERKHNAFLVQSGRLVLSFGEDEGGALVLGPGEYYSVPPGVYHRFSNQGREPVKAHEWYWPDEPSASPLSEDIVRNDVGGVAKCGA